MATHRKAGSDGVMCKTADGLFHTVLMTGVTVFVFLGDGRVY